MNYELTEEQWKELISGLNDPILREVVSKSLSLELLLNEFISDLIEDGILQPKIFKTNLNISIKKFVLKNFVRKKQKKKED